MAITIGKYLVHGNLAPHIQAMPAMVAVMVHAGPDAIPADSPCGLEVQQLFALYAAFVDEDDQASRLELERRLRAENEWVVHGHPAKLAAAVVRVAAIYLFG